MVNEVGKIGIKVHGHRFWVSKDAD
jgi:hypothetical protein